jgi:tetratricopeptide (TPR) repeat protein
MNGTRISQVVEMIDDKMQSGYDVLAEGQGDVQQACRLWLEAWQEILRVMQQQRINSFQAFDGLFGGMQSVFNWVQDLEMELYNAGLENPGFFRERMSLCQTVLERFPNEDKLLIRSFKRGMADTYFHLGEPTKGDQLYEQCLAEDPRWGWGWIGWSDNYFIFNSVEKDAARAEQLLKQGLDVTDIEDRDVLLERLQTVYEESGREDEAEAVRQELQRSGKVDETTEVTTTEAGMQTKTAIALGADSFLRTRTKNGTNHE